MSESRRSFLKWILPSTAITLLSGVSAVSSPEIKGGEVPVNNNNKPCISFIFDDAKESHFSVVAPLFKSKNKTCGFAINTLNINKSGCMLGSDIIELANQGFDIVSHSYTGVVFNNKINETFSRAELETAQSTFSEMGLTPRILQAPGSVAYEQHHPAIRSIFEYAFTKDSNPTPMRDLNPIGLWRYGLELSATEVIPFDKAKAAIDSAKELSGVVIFYAHDVPLRSNKYQLISDIIDYAQSVDVDVVSPSIAVASASLHPNIPSKNYFKRETIINGTDGWEVSNGSISVNSNGDVVITADAAGECLIKRSTPLAMVNGESINFSSAIRKLSGTIRSCYIGLNTFNESTRVKTLELPIVGLDAEYRRYSVAQHIGPSVNRILQFVRVNFSAAGDRVMLYAPTVRYGSNVSQDANYKILQSVGIASGQVIPNSSTAYTSINLVSDPNGLFTTSGSEIKFVRPCRVMLSVSIISNGPSLSASTGGLLRINFGDQSIDIPSTGTKIAGAAHSMTMHFDARSSLSFSMLCIGSEFIIHPSSTILIQEQ